MASVVHFTITCSPKLRVAVGFERILSVEQLEIFKRNPAGGSARFEVNIKRVPFGLASSRHLAF